MGERGQSGPFPWPLKLSLFQDTPESESVFPALVSDFCQVFRGLLRRRWRQIARKGEGCKNTCQLNSDCDWEIKMKEASRLFLCQALDK